MFRTPRRIRARRLRPIHEGLETRCVLSATISEFVASNVNSLEDGFGDSSDWIEIHNTGETPILLRNYALTDDPNNLSKWKFPDRSALGPGQRMIVFASGRDTVDPQGVAHTNFQLDADGEFLALVSPEGHRLSVFDEDEGTFPAMRSDVGYGMSDGPQETIGYLDPATPGAANVAQALSGVAAQPHIDTPGGFYYASIDVVVSSTVPGATLIYTRDSSAPSLHNGVRVLPGSAQGLSSLQIAIEETTVLQVLLVKEGILQSLPAARSYIFPNQILTQSNAIHTGTEFRFHPSVTQRSSDVDPELQTSLIASLSAIPTIAIAMGDKDLWSEDDGIYPNVGEDAGVRRRYANIEIFDGTRYLHAYNWVRTLGETGGAKQSLRVDFRAPLGSTEGIRLEPLSQLSSRPVDGLALRINTNDTQTLLRDQWMRDTIRSMGQPQLHGDVVHLFLNGYYWGLVVATERPRELFAELTNGDGNYDMLEVEFSVGVKANVGSIGVWSEMTQVVANLTFGNDEYRSMFSLDGGRMLDSRNLIDYILSHVFSGAFDWPNNNAIMFRENGVLSKGFKFVAWDQEAILATDHDWITPDADSASLARHTALGVFYSLLSASDFRMEVADAIYDHFYHDGPLTVEQSRQRWLNLADVLGPAYFAESARWTGDEWTKADWLRSVEQVSEEVFPRQHSLSLQRFREYGWYPSIDPPDVHVAEVDQGYKFTMDVPNDNTMYYTIDGSDPRSPGGDVAPNALRYTERVILSSRSTIKARARSPEGEWSALEVTETDTRTQDASAENLRISEFLFHPAGDADAEFIELLNVSDQALELDGVRLAGGISFEFSSKTLLPGERVLVVRDMNTFVERNGSIPAVVGEYDGQLSNGGELVLLFARSGEIIDSVEYDDTSPWPSRADGDGFSLVRRDLLAAGDSAAAWRLSAAIGGTPGFSAFSAGDANLDGRFDSADLVRVFQTGHYEQSSLAEWSDGDWNRDGIFSSADLVLAFQEGQYLTNAVMPNAIAVDELFRRRFRSWLDHKPCEFKARGSEDS